MSWRLVAGHINFDDSRKNEVNKVNKCPEEIVTEIYNGWVIADFRDLHQLAASTALEQLLGSLAPAMPPILVCYL